MGGGSRGVKKPKLRDLSTSPLTTEEQNRLVDAIAAASSPIAQAILGALIVEHDLEQSLRRRLAVKDDAAWLEMLEEQGPFNSFSKKITAGFALGLYNKAIRDNLDIVRVIRNAFAHSRKIIDFDHPLVSAELSKIKVPQGHVRNFKKTKSFSSLAVRYESLCIVLSTSFVRRETRSLRAARNRQKRKTTQRSPFYNALAPALGLGLLPYLPRGSKSPQPTLLGTLSADLEAGAHGGLLAGLLREPPKADDKKGN